MNSTTYSIFPCVMGLIYQRQQWIIYLLFRSDEERSCDRVTNAIKTPFHLKLHVKYLNYRCIVIAGAHTHTHTHTTYCAGEVMALLITTPLPLLLANILHSLSHTCQRRSDKLD